ncbi:MAG: DNA primase [Candidatus Pacebacteria bacterium]|nr:DNA primase [Candidatus Paceibacterota bacterium]
MCLRRPISFIVFSSQKGGDIFTFIQEVEHVDFRGALALLAEKAGITLNTLDKKENDEKTTLYAIMDAAARFYEVQLRKDADAVAYLTGRGLTKETIADFRIGYAGTDWQHLYNFLRSKGYTDTLIEKAGLALQGKRGMYDRFRERIMFPIADSQGRIVAFTGRIFVKESSVTDPTQTGKYINSPETPIYHKSHILFGYDRAKKAMMEHDVCIVVEGQMDVIMSHQAGVRNTVALSGTALTEYHIGYIQRFVDTVVFALDADKAGIEATKKSARLAYAADMSVSVIPITHGKDPADMIADNPQDWIEALSHPVSYIEYRLSTLQSIDDLKKKNTLVHQDIFPFIEVMKSDIMKDDALQKVSHMLRVTHDAVRNDFASWQAKNPEERIVSSQSAHATKNQGFDMYESIHPLERDILGILIWKKIQGKDVFPHEKYLTEYKNLVGEAWFEQAWARAEKYANRLIFDIELRYDGDSQDSVERDLRELLRQAALKKWEKEQRRIIEELRHIEQSGDEEASQKLLDTYQSITQTINKLKEELSS